MVRRYTKRYFTRLLDCYDSELRRDPHVADAVTTVNVHFVISETGTLTSVIARSHRSHAAITSCVTSTIAGATFPPAKRATEVRYTLAYSVPR